MRELIRGAGRERLGQRGDEMVLERGCIRLMQVHTEEGIW